MPQQEIFQSMKIVTPHSILIQVNNVYLLQV